MNTKRSKMSFNESAVRDKESRENQSLPSVDNYETWKEAGASEGR